MSKIIDEMQAEAAAKAAAEATIETSSKIAISLLNDKMPVDLVAKHTGLPLVLVEKLAAQQKANGLPS